MQSRPFFDRFWLSGPFNLLVSGLLTCISLGDILTQPFGEWTVDQPAPFTHRAPATHNSAADELLDILDQKAIQAPFLTQRDKVVREQDLAELQRLLPERAQLDFTRAGGILLFYFLCLTFFNLVLRRFGRHILLRFRAVASIYLVLLGSLLASRLLLMYTTLSVHFVYFSLVAVLFTPLVSQNIGFLIHLLLLALIAPMTPISSATSVSKNLSIASNIFLGIRTVF